MTLKSHKNAKPRLPRTLANFSRCYYKNHHSYTKTFDCIFKLIDNHVTYITIHYHLEITQECKVSMLSMIPSNLTLVPMANKNKARRKEFRMKDIRGNIKRDERARF